MRSSFRNHTKENTCVNESVFSESFFDDFNFEIYKRVEICQRMIRLSFLRILKNEQHALMKKYPVPN